MPGITVNAASLNTGVPPATIRYYVRRGLLAPRRDPSNGYQRFTSQDLQRIRFIRQAQSLGFSLREIETILTTRGAGAPACHLARAFLARRVEAGREALDELKRRQERMERTLVRWSGLPDRTPLPSEICPLIEHFEDAD